MKKAILLFIFQLCSLAMFAQINTDRVLTIGRNALYFEDYVLSIQYFNQVIKSKPWLAEPYFYRRQLSQSSRGSPQEQQRDCGHGS